MNEMHPQTFDLFKWFRKYYILLIIGVLFLYLLFAFIAPVLMRSGHVQLSKSIYRIYSNFCHQFAHRSWFLFGKQIYYPMQQLESLNVHTIQDIFGIDIINEQSSREIIGNSNAGYKIAICQRDVAIYGSMFIFAVIFYLSKRQIKKIPLWVWFVFAVFPIGVDGTWQLISSIGLFDTRVINYESTPMLRTITGILFGAFTSLFLYPAIEETFVDDEKGLIKKVLSE